MKRLVTTIVLMSFAASAWTLEQGAAPRGAPAPAAAAPVPSAPAATAGNEPSALQPAVQTSPSAAATPAQDRIELDTTQITGNRELPRVLYVVPWKRPDLGDPDGRPANSLLDEVLAPVDRDVFRRQNRYYQALKPDAVAPGKGNSTEGEK